MSNAGYPEGQALESYMQKRKRTGLFWRIAFQAATIVAIITLTALIYNIVIGAFGFVAVQNKVDPASLVLTVEEARMLQAPGTQSSEPGPLSVSSTTT